MIELLAGEGHCSERDLLLAIANEVHNLGKRFIAYLPCEVAGNVALHKGFAWNTQDCTNPAEFKHRYLEWKLFVNGLRVSVHCWMAGGSMVAMNGRSSTVGIWIDRHGMKPPAQVIPTG